MKNAPFSAGDMMSRLYHQNHPMQQGQQPMQRPQGGQSAMGQILGSAQQRPQGGNPYNAGGSGAMNAIIWQLMQRKGF